MLNIGVRAGQQRQYVAPPGEMIAGYDCGVFKLLSAPPKIKMSAPTTLGYGSGSFSTTSLLLSGFTERTLDTLLHGQKGR